MSRDDTGRCDGRKLLILLDFDRKAIIPYSPPKVNPALLGSLVLYYLNIYIKIYIDK